MIARKAVTISIQSKPERPTIISSLQRSSSVTAAAPHQLARLGRVEPFILFELDPDLLAVDVKTDRTAGEQIAVFGCSDNESDRRPNEVKAMRFYVSHSVITTSMMIARPRRAHRRRLMRCRRRA
jgi:hypothetical protein